MKKLINLALAVLIMVGILTLGVSAHKDFKSWGNVPSTDNKITLDGKIDDIYKKGLIVDVATRTDGKTGGATGKAYLVYSGSTLYCAFEVNDPEICPADNAKNAWENDGIEVTLDWKNDGSTRHKWMIRYDGNTVPAGDGKVEEVKVAVTSTKTSYIIEMAITLPEGVKAGSQIGINLLIDDMTEGGKTRGIIRSVQSGNATENEVAKFDYIVLSSDKVSVAAPAASTSSPKTFDPVAAFFAVSAVSAAGILVLKKKQG
jgi:hypothetical protein